MYSIASFLGVGVGESLGDGFEDGGNEFTLRMW